MNQKYKELTVEEIRNVVQADCDSVSARIVGNIRGKPDMFPSSLAIETWAQVSRLNPNNGGIHTLNTDTSSKRESPWAPFRAREVEVIDWVAQLLCRKLDEVAGYVISGSTEGNIMGLWSARNGIQNKIGSDARIVVLVARTAHFSLFKAADLLGFQKVQDALPSNAAANILVSVDLDEQFRLDTKILQETIKQLSSAGFRGFIVVATVGSTVTGAVDPVVNIAQMLQSFESQSGILTALHVDAAFGGLIAPFVENETVRSTMDWRSERKISSFTLDFHKLGGLPYGCGVFMAEKESFQNISRSANYTATQVDATLLGSRSGAMSAALWSVIRHKGYRGFAEDATRSLDLTKRVASRLSTVPGISLVMGGLNHIGICLDPNHGFTQPIQAFLESKAVFGETIEREASVPPVLIYPLYLMPDIEEAVVESFLSELELVAHSA
ncbi:MAG: hypothetical protein K2X29_09170 [Candidatus Obscuribacterales bacterium]|nr:hypothetical protein [Candidatus Obscuribacterales bacterium]